MRFPTYLIPLAALFVGSCGEPSLSFSVESGFTDEERQELHAAAAVWNSVANEPISIDGGAWRIRRAWIDTGVVGRTDHLHHIVYIRPELEPDRVRVVAMHEFGHVHGLQHTEHGVMFWNVGADESTIYLADEDIAECRRVAACP